MRLHQIHSLTFPPAHLLYYIIYIPHLLWAAKIGNDDLFPPGKPWHMQQVP